MSLEIAKNITCSVGRIGYNDEGIRVTFFDDMPFNCHFEIQLSRRDTEALIELLRNELLNKRSSNLP